MWTWLDTKEGTWTRREGIVGGRVLSRCEAQGETRAWNWGLLVGGEPLFLSWRKGLVPVGGLGREVGSITLQGWKRLSLSSLLQRSQTCWKSPWSWSALRVGSVGEIGTHPSLSASRTRDFMSWGRYSCGSSKDFKKSLSHHVVWNGSWAWLIQSAANKMMHGCHKFTEVSVTVNVKYI